MESDQQLRERLKYVAGDRDLLTEIERANGMQLDDIAERYNLRRRRLP